MIERSGSQISEATFHIRDTIHPLLYENGVIFLDEATGQFRRLNKFGRNVLEIINMEGQESALRNHFLERAGLLPQQAETEATNWIRFFLLQEEIIESSTDNITKPRQLPIARQFSEKELSHVGDTPLAWTDIENVGLTETEQTLATAALERSLALGQSIEEEGHYFGDMLHYLRDLQSNDYRPATEAELLHILAAVYYVGKDYMGRLNCLEMAVAGFIANAIQKRRSKLVFGAQLDPNRFHAWIETTSGTAIRLATDPPINGLSHPFLYIE